jgi:hypothetical protein
MNRPLTYLLGPETVLTLLGLLVFWFCARHSSGERHDVDQLEKLVWLLPFIVVPCAFATVFVPGAKTWWWLGRAIVPTFVMLIVCGLKIVDGFGSGAKGQDAALIIIATFGTVAVSLASAVAGAIILAANRPAFGEWFQARPVLGSVLTALAALPIGAVLGGAIMLVFSVFVFVSTLLKR